MKELCKVEGCCNKAMPNRTHGLCRKHYEISLHGHVRKKEYKKSDKKCSVQGCCNGALSAYKHGLCSKHYLQMLECGEVYQTDFEKRMQSLSDRSQMVIEDLKSGMERNEVREKYSLTRSNLKYIIDQYGDESMKIDQSLTVEQIAQKLIDNGTELKYAGEYKRGQYVLLHCDVCGCTMRYAASALFKHVNCKQCKEIAKLSQKQELAAQREADRKAKAEAAEERKRIQEQERAAMVRGVYCAVCGEMFQTTNPLRVTCSAECGRKRANTRHTRNKDTRIPKDKRIDRIDLHDLFKRDDGVCHICGKQCNWNDYTVTDTTIIAGNWYPSVDHIVPVSLGGADAWDNVKLAHRICNSLRGNKV